MNYSNFSVGNGLILGMFLLVLFSLLAAGQGTPQVSTLTDPQIQPQDAGAPIQPVPVVRPASSPAPSQLVKLQAQQTTQENMTQQQVILIQQTKKLDKLQKNTRKALNRLRAKRKKLKAQKKLLRRSTKKVNRKRPKRGTP